jgi:hypothetical protein
MSRVRGFGWVLLCLAAAAQTPDTAGIHGTIVDASHAAVSAVEVVVTNSRSGLERKTRSDSSGDFLLSGLPVTGRYSVTASKPGFETAHLNNVVLSGGTTADLDLELSIAGGATKITVTGVPGEIRADQPQLGDHLSAQQIEDVPILNRKMTFLPLLNAANRPALNQGDVFMNEFLFTSNGAGRRQAWFEVDGANAVDLWGRQTVFASIPLAGIEQMSILTNAFSAEYGGSTGTVINLVTKAGANQFHGEALYANRPSGPEAALAGFTSKNAANGNDLTNDTLNQGSVALSGPLGAGGHSQFFLDADYSAENRASPVISPLAPGNFIGHYRQWLGLARIDHQINDRNNLFFRGNLDAFFDTNPNGTVGGNTLPSVDRVFKRRTYSAELGETAILSPTLLNNVRAQYQLASPITQFAPTIYSTQYQVPISSGGTFTTGTSQSALLLNHQYEFNDVLSMSRAAHQVKVGADVIFAHNGGNSKEFGGPITLGQFVYKACTLDVATCESQAYLGNLANVQSYTQSYGSTNYTVDDTLWSLFAQDDYRVRPDLTVNLGLRYEQQTFTDSRRDFAPRAGFAYNWRGDGKTVIRGGFGIYYSQVVDDAQANYALSGPTGVFNYTATAGQVGFPASVTAVPLPAFPAGAQMPVRTLYVRPGRASYYDRFFPTATLKGYPGALLNPYSEQWTFGIQRSLQRNWVLSADYVGSHTVRINRPLDLDSPAPFVRTAPGQTRSAQAANCTRPYWIWWYGQQGLACNPAAASNPQPPYSVITTDVNDGFATYEALDVNLSHTFSRRLSMLASYTWSHSIDNVDPDIPNQNPNDPNFTAAAEKGNAIFDQRHRFVLSVVWVGPLAIDFGGVATLASGLPFNYVTGVNNSGDTGATTDRPVINGAVVARNAGRGRPIYDVSPFLERPFALGERVRLLLRAEAFNVFNHPNFVGYSGTYGNGTVPGNGFGAPLAGITNQLPARSLQFSGRLTF